MKHFCNNNKIDTVYQFDPVAIKYYVCWVMAVFSGAWCLFSAFCLSTCRQVQIRAPQTTCPGRLQFQQAGSIIVS